MIDFLGAVPILMVLAFMAARTAPPMAATVDGEPKLEVELPLLFRVLDQRVNIIAVLAILILGSGLVGERWISHGMFLFAIVAMFGILMLPRRYRFTTRGISPNKATFRAWNEFEAWQTRGNVVRLEGAERFSSLNLYVADTDRADVLKLIAQYVQSIAVPHHTSLDRKGRGVQRLARSKGGTR